MIKAEAIEAGYEPDECAVDVRVRWEMVYVTETGEETTKIYHTNKNCKHLDDLREDGSALLRIIQPLWRLGEEFRKCLDCDEERHIEL